VVLISAGAAAGVVLLQWRLGAALLLPTALTTAAALVGHLAVRPRG
jgi:hypothetical protein